jgi:molecular chaperone Hsp31 and glyoxalase 3
MGCCSSQLNANGDYDPSSFTQKAFVASKSDYKKQEYSESYTGDKSILVVCTDDGRLAMSNGKVFSSGNHPVEMLVPMMHFRDAGFKFDFATTTGKPVVLEMWANPTKDAAVQEFYASVKPEMDAPKKLEDIKTLDAYVGVFIPGGHGAMVNLPESVALGKLLHIAHEKAMPTITLCHGPATLLSTKLEGTGKPFAYKGYEIMCFTDKTDAKTPMFGYLPGPMPWQCQKTLEENGVTVKNTSETGACTVDRELISGDSPQAAHNLGVLAAPILVKFAIDNKL